MKRHTSWSLLVLFCAALVTNAAALKTRNVFLIMTDGLRWEEVFTGAEERLITKELGGVGDTNALRAAFWRDTSDARRETLMPFTWSEIARKGQIFGNQKKGSVVRVSNGKNFSYPGYNEIFTGRADSRIDSNGKKPNPNVTVFEWIDRQKDFRNRTALFATWDVFPYIFNCERSGLPIWPGWGEKFVKEIQVPPVLAMLHRDTPVPASGTMVFDSFAYHASLDYVKREKPRVVFVGVGETDQWAHEKKYDDYLHAAHRVDRYIGELWTLLQSMSQYRDKTTLIITSDHGRGHGPDDWKDHGEKTPGAESNWIIALGPDTPPLGERSNTPPLSVDQIASTMAELLGLNYQAFFSQAGAPISDVIARK